ncbi:hypothetical protein [Aneurinibacillus tyrosinisolvens]|uniref:hypothetical protein n=1 Tax=Aneurinibacillus tyrosinisolvens TaxID=1443435 RepID=UPI00063F8677|nr:hypothetical protein [Aneurinibacillus tyrosinisolvens]
MENEDFKNSLDLLQQLTDSFQSLAGQDRALSHYNQSIHAIKQSFKQLANSANTSGIANEQMEEVRKGITSLRMTVQQMTNRLEQSQDESVQAYRRILGESKEQFESASDSQKQTMNAEAYHSLQLYNGFKNTIGLLNRFDGELMDASQEVEHEMINQMPHPNIHLEKDFENDPAPHPLT